MKLSSALTFSLLSILSAACISPAYSATRVGPDAFILRGPDPVRLRGNAYRACQEADPDYTSYTVVSSERGTLSVRCQGSSLWNKTLDRAGELYNGTAEKSRELYHRAKEELDKLK